MSPDHGDPPGAPQARQLYEQQSHGPIAQQDERPVASDLHAARGVNHTGQRLEKRRAAIGDRVGNLEHVSVHDLAREQYVLAIGAQREMLEQMQAKVLGGA